MKALFSILISMAAVMLPAATQAQPQNPTSDQSIREFVHQAYIRGVPYEEISRFDASSATPILLEMLANPREEEFWPNIVVALGMLGDERAVAPLIQFLERNEASRPLSHAQYIAKSSVVMSLGYIINKTGSPRALEYLKASMSPTIWRQRKVEWSSPYHPTAEARDRQLSKMAILGLGLSGRPFAAEALRSLRAPATAAAEESFRRDVAGLVSEALSANDEIGKEGLAAYYQKSRPGIDSPGE
jgi:hypothetical protein